MSVTFLTNIDKQEMSGLISANATRISRNEKRLDNIEHGLAPDKHYVDATVAYRKSVPAEAGPFALVETVGGMTRKCGNLLKLDDRSPKRCKALPIAP